MTRTKLALLFLLSPVLGLLVLGVQRYGWRNTLVLASTIAVVTALGSELIR